MIKMFQSFLRQFCFLRLLSLSLKVKKRRNQQHANVHCFWKMGRVQKPQRKAFVDWKAERCSESHCCQCRKTCRSEKKCGFLFSCQRCRDEVTTGFGLAAWVKCHIGNHSRVWPEGGFISNGTRPHLARKTENVFWVNSPIWSQNINMIWTVWLWRTKSRGLPREKPQPAAQWVPRSQSVEGRKCTFNWK